MTGSVLPIQAADLRPEVPTTKSRAASSPSICRSLQVSSTRSRSSTSRAMVTSTSVDGYLCTQDGTEHDEGVSGID